MQTEQLASCQAFRYPQQYTWQFCSLEQGKALNEELKHDIQEQKEEKKSAACAADVTEKLEHLNAEDLAKIKEKLAELEEKQKNCDCES